MANAYETTKTVHWWYNGDTGPSNFHVCGSSSLAKNPFEPFTCQQCQDPEPKYIYFSMIRQCFNKKYVTKDVNERLLIHFKWQHLKL